MRADPAEHGIAIGQEGVLVRKELCPEIKEIPKKCDLKEEIRIKRENQHAEEEKKKLIEEEGKIREQLLRDTKTVLSLCEFVLQLVQHNGRLLEQVQVGLVNALNTCLKFCPANVSRDSVATMLNHLLSYVHGKRIVLATNAQPLVLAGILKDLFEITEERCAEIIVGLRKEQSEFPMRMCGENYAGSFHELL